MGRLIGILTVISLCTCVMAGEGFWETHGPYGGFMWRAEYDCGTPGLCYAGGENGFFRSEDGGLTWERSIPRLTPTESGVYCSSFCVSKVLPQLIFARIGYFEEHDRFFRSDDGGRTWSGLFVPWGYSYINHIACDPGDPDHVCVAVEVDTYQGELFESRDRGLSWDMIYSGREPEVVCIDPNDSDTIWIGCNYAFPKRTTDGGATWEDVGAGLTQYDCVYPNGIYVSPGDSATVFFCSGLSNLYRWDEDGHIWNAVGISANDICFCADDPLKMFACDYSGFYSSSDGGESWMAHDVGLGGIFIDVCPTNPDEVLVADLTGIWRSTDGCLAMDYSCEGLVAEEINYLVPCDEASSVLVCGGYRCVAKSVDAGLSWQLNDWFLDHYALCLAQDPSVPNTLYASDSYDDLLYVSRDAGENWERFCSFPLSVSVVHHIAVDPTDSETLYLAVYDYTVIFRTRDAGLSWDSLNVYSSSSEYVSTDFVAIDPSAPRRIFVCSFLDGLFRSTDGGESFEKSGVRTLPTFVYFDPGNPATVYAGCSYAGGLYRSLTSGDSWQKLVTPVESIYDMAFNPSDSNDFYISGYKGVHHTRDGGETWTSLSTQGLQCAYTTAIVVDFGEAGNTVHAAGAAVFSYFEPLTPFVGLSTSDTRYRVGDTIHIGLDLANPGNGMFADLAVAVGLPNGTLVYLPSLWTSYSPFYSGWIPGQFSLSDYTLLEAPVDAGLPSGIYCAYAALLQQGTMTFISNLATCQFRITTSG